MKNVYEMGVHVIHSDADVVWFNDPLPYFMSLMKTPVHIVIGTDSVTSFNSRGDAGLEVSTNPHTNINTGGFRGTGFAGRVILTGDGVSGERLKGCVCFTRGVKGCINLYLQNLNMGKWPHVKTKTAELNFRSRL